LTRESLFEILARSATHFLDPKFSQDSCETRESKLVARLAQIASLANCETHKLHNISHFSLLARLVRLAGLALIFSREASLISRILARKIAKRDSLSTLLKSP
jgi:hypothetical protein